MKKNTLKLHTYCDPGHAWLRVTVSQLYASGVKNDISTYSYMNKTPAGKLYIYLEEDRDAGIFVNAMKARGYKIEFKSHYADGQSRVRSYPAYSSDYLTRLEKWLSDIKPSGMHTIKDL